jgi:hypothetical protein
MVRGTIMQYMLSRKEVYYNHMDALSLVLLGLALFIFIG